MTIYFTNPYNFVPFGEKCEKSPLKLGKEECLTGYFTCRLELLTPLFIPNTSYAQALCNADEKGGGYVGYEFSSYEDLSGGVNRNEYTEPPMNPVIPGSAIRGPVRSVFEAAFDGCMSTTVMDEHLGRRCSNAKKAGILRIEGDKGWLTPCKRAMLNVEGCGNSTNRGQSMDGIREYSHLKEGQEIWIQLSKENYKINIDVKVIERYSITAPKNMNGYILGWLHKGEPFHLKHHESVFYSGNSDKESDREIKISSEEIKRFKLVLEEYQGTNRYQHMNLNMDRILVYYTDETGEPAYLSPACIGREVFSTTLKTVLKNNGDFTACEKIDNLCPACKVFGMVAKESGENGAIGSRVRFTDALPKKSINAADYYQPLVLPESGQPRPGAVEFYTQPPFTESERKDMRTEGYWTYDYKRMSNGQIKRIVLDDCSPKLRGRKFYWHHGNYKEICKDNKNEKLGHQMRQRIRPMKPSVLGAGTRVFEFQVYFDRLNREELDRLRWALDFADKTRAHKMGRGKPFGFGSVRIHVDDLQIRRLDPESGEIRLFKEPLDLTRKEIVNVNKEPITSLKIMANWVDYPKDASYPYVNDKKGRAFEWFTKNKDTILNPAFVKVLPKAIEEYGKEIDSSKRLTAQPKNPRR